MTSLATSLYNLVFPHTKLLFRKNNGITSLPICNHIKFHSNDTKEPVASISLSCQNNSEAEEAEAWRRGPSLCLITEMYLPVLQKEYPANWPNSITTGTTCVRLQTKTRQVHLQWQGKEHNQINFKQKSNVWQKIIRTFPLKISEERNSALFTVSQIGPVHFISKILLASEKTAVMISNLIVNPYRCATSAPREVECTAHQMRKNDNKAIYL